MLWIEESYAIVTGNLLRFFLVCFSLTLYLIFNFSTNFYIQEFKNGLRPVHIAPNTLPRPSSTDDNERGGTKPPSLQTTPVTPHSPLSAFSPFNSPRVSPLPSRRPPSPRRIDMGFASAVSNLVEQAHSIADQDRRKAYGEIRVFSSRMIPCFCRWPWCCTACRGRHVNISHCLWRNEWYEKWKMKLIFVTVFIRNQGRVVYRRRKITPGCCKKCCLGDKALSMNMAHITIIMVIFRAISPESI